MLTRPAPDALAFSTDSGLLEAKALRVFRIAPAALIQLAAAIGVEERENGGRERGVDLRIDAPLPHRGTAQAARPQLIATQLVAGLGREACRALMCQDVKISVVAVA